MNIEIGCKTNKPMTEPCLSYLGFYDRTHTGDDPYVHVDGDEIAYKTTPDGFHAELRGAYDFTNGRYLTDADLANLKLMYAQVEDDYPDEDFEIERVWLVEV